MYPNDRLIIERRIAGILLYYRMKGLYKRYLKFLGSKRNQGGENEIKQCAILNAKNILPVLFTS